MKLCTQAGAAGKFSLIRRSRIHYEAGGLIESVRTPGDRYRYCETELLLLCGLEAKVNQGSNRAGLCGRVSVRKQADAGNLGRQTQ